MEKYYRIVALNEINIIIQDGILSFTNIEYSPYPANTVIFIFKSDNLIELLNRYGHEPGIKNISFVREA